MARLQALERLQRNVLHDVQRQRRDDVRARVSACGGHCGAQRVHGRAEALHDEHLDAGVLARAEPDDARNALLVAQVAVQRHPLDAQLRRRRGQRLGLERDAAARAHVHRVVHGAKAAAAQQRADAVRAAAQQRATLQALWRGARHPRIDVYAAKFGSRRL